MIGDPLIAATRFDRRVLPEKNSSTGAGWIILTFVFHELAKPVFIFPQDLLCPTILQRATFLRPRSMSAR